MSAWVLASNDSVYSFLSLYLFSLVIYPTIDFLTTCNKKYLPKFDTDINGDIH